jgi:hypothetical protein
MAKPASRAGAISSTLGAILPYSETKDAGSPSYPRFHTLRNNTAQKEKQNHARTINRQRHHLFIASLLV